MLTNSNSTEWLKAMADDESEGTRTPAQAPIEIRADFPRRQFCLYVNGEAVGASSQYKAVWLARRFLIGELS